MNLQQAKALFNAQYLGQNVLSHIEAPNLVTTLSSDYLFKGDKQWFLLLRTVDQLTDVEALIVKSIFKYSRFNDTGKGFAKSILNSYNPQNQQEAILCYQYLLRIGILLSFTYLNEENQPITLQPDEIIALGWAKIELTASN